MKNIENAILYRAWGSRVGKEVVIHSSNERKQYFFSTRHLMLDKKGEILDPDGTFVPCTYTLPMSVVPRKGLEDGWVDTVAKLIQIFHYDETEIENPYAEYRIREE